MGDRDAVEGGVGLPVSSSVEPMPAAGLAGSGRYGADAGTGLMPDVTFNFTGPGVNFTGPAAAAASAGSDAPVLAAAATEFARVDAFQWLIYE